MQWENDNGYCGETSVQSIALYNGAWVSQQTVRTLAGGELLLGVNADKALKKLHFQFESWRGSGSSQFQSYMAWMKKNLSAGVPVIFAAYLSGSSDSDYDHIMPAIGVQSTNATGGFGSSDKLEWNTLFSSQTVTNTFGALGGSRSSCKLSIGKGGCVPLGVDYGIAVPGFLDKDQATLPIKLTVDKASEPNLSQGAAPGTLQGTLTVYGLQPGRNYALLRYNGFESVPESGTPADYLKSAFGNRVTFTAKTGSWSYTDPNTIKTDSTTYYKVVPVTP
jgi:hypothetical protein